MNMYHKIFMLTDDTLLLYSEAQKAALQTCMQNSSDNLLQAEYPCWIIVFIFQNKSNAYYPNPIFSSNLDAEGKAWHVLSGKK